MSRLELKDKGGFSSGDTLSAVPSGDTLRLELSKLWYGDDETGFGLEVDFELTAEKVAEMRDFLTMWIETRERQSRNG